MFQVTYKRSYGQLQYTGNYLSNVIADLEDHLGALNEKLNPKLLTIELIGG